MDVRTRFEQLRDATEVDPDDLDQLWSHLRPQSVEAMLGGWRGGDFATGHPAGALLGRIDWHGKRFESPLEVHPLICRGEDGGLYSNTEYAGGQLASLWSVEFRGEPTATMVYDAMPVLDHFKRVDDDTVLGVMNGKLESTFGVADLYWFWLERER